MKNLDLLMNGMYTFNDETEGKLRINIVAHGCLVGKSAMMVVPGFQGGKFGDTTRYVDVDELSNLLKTRYPLYSNDIIRTLTCFSGDGGEQSFGARLCRKTGLPVQCFIGPMTGNYTPEKITALFSEALESGIYHDLAALFSAKYRFEVKDRNPYRWFSRNYFAWQHHPVTFQP